MGILTQDIRYGWRVLAKNPGFTIVTALTLALGIGANTAIFSVIDAAVFHALPYPSSNRLVHLWETRPSREFAQMEASRPDFLDWQVSNHVFTGLAGYSEINMSLLNRGTPKRIAAARVTANFFDVLEVQPRLGRTFRVLEDRSNGEHVAVLNYGLWQSEFGGDQKIIGQTIDLSGEAYTVVGILPRQFQFAKRGEAELWVPLNPGAGFGAQFPGEADQRSFHWINMIARLRPGVTLAQAQAEMTNLAMRLAKQYPSSNAGGGVRVLPLQEEIVGPVQPILIALLAAVAMVLLIACVNVTNLLLAKAKNRQREIAVRLALGASMERLFRQMLTESMMLAFLGGAIGVLWAKWVVQLIVAQIPGNVLAQMPYLRGLSPNIAMLQFTLAISIVTGILFGVLPALHTSNTNPQEALTEGERTIGSAAHHRVRNALIVSEIAFSLVLLIGAGLLMKSLMRILQVDPGFQTDNLLTFEISAPPGRYADPKRNEAFTRQLLSTAQDLPGVRGAALIDITPLKGGNTAHFAVEGEPEPAPDQKPEANVRDVSPNYFSVMAIPLLRGRFFVDQDRPDSPAVIIVNKTLADRVFPGEDPVGHRLIFNFGTPLTLEIVGVVGDEKLGPLDQETHAVIYASTFQSTDTDLTLMVRSPSDPGSLATSLRVRITNFDANIVLNSAVTMRKIIADSPSVFVRRFPALLIGTFAILALLLSAIGIYGVLSYLVTQRTREIGVRIALGARKKDVLRMLIGEGMRLAAVGIAIGIVLSIGATRLLMSLLFEVHPVDLLVAFTAIGVTLGVAALACSIPSLRATKIAPLEALRWE